MAPGKRTWMGAASVVALLAASGLALAHTPSSHAQETCYTDRATPDLAPLPGVNVVGTMSHWWSGPITPGCMGRDFASDAGTCPLPPSVGPVAGAYCGPLVLPGVPGVLPAGSVQCSGEPVVLAPGIVPALTVAWDVNFDGVITPGEPATFFALYTAFPSFSGSHVFSNPTGTLARVIAFPTNGDFPMTGTTSATDQWRVTCE